MNYFYKLQKESYTEVTQRSILIQNIESRL